jgi:hypothetical protein
MRSRKTFKKICVQWGLKNVPLIRSSVVKKNKVGELEIKIFFFHFISNSNEYIANSAFRVFMLYFLYPWIAHLSLRWMCSITLGLLEFFLERDNNISRVIWLKSRVGRVSRNTTVFFKAWGYNVSYRMSMV